MKIVLLRHGKPDIPDPARVKAGEIHKWIELYNSAGIRKDHRPSKKLMETAKNCGTVVCSDLPRSIESAKMLGAREIHYIESIFREVGLPYGDFPSPKLPANVWAVLFRILWIFGYSPNCESLSEAKKRALKGTTRLKEISKNNGSVLFVGHGFINRFIAKELLSNGWQGPASPGRKFWEFGVYKYPT